MRVAPCVILLMGLCLALIGCNTPSKKSGSQERQPFPPGSEPKKSPEIPDPLASSAGSLAQHDALLAGQLIDGHTGRPIAGYVRWQCLDEVREEAAPIDVAVGADGYFTIQGLKRGKHYKLSARAKQGERALAGAHYTTAPNIRVLISMKEELVPPGGAANPGPPNAPGAKGLEPADSKTSLQPMDQPVWAQNGWKPGRPALGADPTRGPSAIRIQQPVPMAPGDTPGQPGEPNWQRGSQISSPAPQPPPDFKRIAAGNGHAKAPVLSIPSTTFVPSCLLVGKQLHNFALRDLNGDVWEYKKNRRGKLVLLDFWGTTCRPCLEAVPNLRQLQERYGGAGLEVVGIAYENGGSPEEQAKRVAAACQKFGIHYQVLLGAGRQCPVLQQFNVRYLPTLHLIGENGWVLWQHEGSLDTVQREDLELQLKRWLGTR